MTGTRPVIDFMFADFVLDSVGEIINQIAKMQYMSSGRLKMPILLRGCIGIGHSAATHHSGNYYPMYAHFPGLRVVVPSTPYDAKGLLNMRSAATTRCSSWNTASCWASKGPVPDEDYEIEFGQAAVVREGSDVTVVALALMVHHTLKVCERLAEEGISVELIDPRTVAPLDVETIRRSVAKTGRLLIVDEAFAPFGIGAEIAAQLADRGFDDLDAPIRRLNGAFTRRRRTARRWKPPSSRRPRRSPRRSATSWPNEGKHQSWRAKSRFPGSAGTWTKALRRLAQERRRARVRPANRCSAWKATRPRRISKAWKRESCAFRPMAPRTATRSRSAP